MFMVGIHKIDFKCHNQYFKWDGTKEIVDVMDSHDALSTNQIDDRMLRVTSVRNPLGGQLVDPTQVW
eukprot:12175233-Prorocentrum_lima.AAC.1